MTALSSSALAGALLADGPAGQLGEAPLYGFLAGSWDAQVRIHRPGEEVRLARGEIHAGWVLAGRALQDVWILPGVFHGTTLRLHDPGLDAWRIHWLDPVLQSYPRMIGRAEGADVVQLGENADGAQMRWSFHDIRPDSFHWRAEISPDGEAWRLQVEFLARRQQS